MIKLLSLIVMLLFGFSSASYARIIVQSDQHQAFDRLLIFLTSDQNWELSQDRNTYTFSVEGLDIGFDIAALQNQLEGKRLRSINSTQDSIEFKLNCECSLVSNQLATGQVVIDIFGDIETTQPSEMKLSDRLNRQKIVVNSDFKRVNQDPELAKFRKQLLLDMSRSLSLSILDRQQNVDIAPVDILDNPPNIFNDTEASRRITTYNSVDAARGANSRNGTKAEALTCPSDEHFNISNWAVNNSFSETVSKKRRRLNNDLEVPKTEQKIALARAYFYFGLAAEAKSIIRKDKDSSHDTRLLLELIDLLENRQGREYDLLRGLVHCTGKIIPWLLLSNPSSYELSEENRKELVFEVSRWPPAVQEIMGAEIGKILFSRGFDTTGSVINALSRNGNSFISSRQTDLELLALEELGNIIRADNERSPYAMEIFLSRSIAQNRNIGQEDLELAMSYAFELQGLPISSALIDQVTHSLAHVGRTNELLEMLRKTKSIDRTRVENIIDQIIQTSIEKKNRPQIALVGIFALENSLLEYVRDQNIDLLTEQLLDFHLPNLVQDLNGSRVEKRNTRNTDARLQMLNGNLDAILEISGVNDDMELQSRIIEFYLNKGEAQTAKKLLETASPVDIRDRTMFASGSWNDLTSDSLEREISQAIVESSTLRPNDKPITEGREILSLSANGREVISKILTSQ